MILYEKAAGRITLLTEHTAYQMLADPDGRLRHIAYGARCQQDLADPRPAHRWDKGCWPDLLPLEYGAPGTGDYRTPALMPEYADGTEAADFRFESAEVRPGKYTLPGLPAFAADPAQGAETLAVTLRDAAGLKVTLLYGVLPALDLITRAVLVENTGAAPVRLRKAASLCLDYPPRPLDLITLNGTWAAERTPERAAVRSGVQSVGGVRGIPGHAHNPAVVLCAPDAGEEQGECWGFAFVYSGNFLAEVEKSDAGTRLTVGIHPQHFCWTLAPGESFAAPEVAMVYADTGLGGMSRRFHAAIRAALLPARWRDPAKKRPVLINSWEACYFDFDEQKLLELARAAKKADIDLFVLDDGWFRGRNDDTTSLGDWVCDPVKLPGGIPALCKKVNGAGLAFGIWFEPEAISPDSALYCAHPDWALEIPGRETLPIRSQYTLDFSRAEVREGIWQQMKALLDACPVAYLKWDMNRSLADVYSAGLPAARQGEVYHRYVLGLYELQRRLTDRYPDLLLENCAGGGARFDCGMLAYSPQIWCSDNTDALDRLTIQYGTSLFYPAETMGAHFSTVPNHTTGRTATVQARMAAALSGTFGFELDLTKWSDAELAALRPYLAWYRENGALVRGGQLYRLEPPRPDLRGAAWMFAAPDGSAALVFAVGEALRGVNPRLPLRGLTPGASYRAELLGGASAVYPADVLLHAGLPLEPEHSDLPAVILRLARV